jgi:hypothetical protein
MYSSVFWRGRKAAPEELKGRAVGVEILGAVGQFSS